MENNNKAKPKNKFINLNSHISKPSFLMTVNPDKFLQKPNRKSAMSIKSRKVDTIKKFFDDNYNKKHGINKENYYKLNKTLLF